MSKIQIRPSSFRNSKTNQVNKARNREIQGGPSNQSEYVVEVPIRARQEVGPRSNQSINIDPKKLSRQRHQ